MNEASNYYKGLNYIFDDLNKKLKNSGNLIIICKDKLLENEYISVADDIIHNFYKLKEDKRLKYIFIGKIFNFDNL